MRESPRVKSLVVDVDGTLCPIKNDKESYSELSVNTAVVAKLRQYKADGFKIVLHTARNMRTYNGNIGEINKHTAPVLLEWLNKNNIPFDEIHYGKPWPGNHGFYLDDRSVRPREFVANDFASLEALMLRDRTTEDQRTQIVIPMAGRGSRFTHAGYSSPKYEISTKGLTLFYWSMLSLSDFIRREAQFYFVVLKENSACEFVQRQCLLLGINHYRVIEVEEVTEGQASTVMAAEPYWSAVSPLLIYNIDTYVEPGAIRTPERKGVDGWIPCMKADGDHWSFVSCKPDGTVTNVAEKQRISNNCSIGLYWFGSCELYVDCYRQFYSTWNDENEKYVAPMYNVMIDQGYSVRCTVFEKEQVHALGTPKELDEFRYNA